MLLVFLSHFVHSLHKMDTGEYITYPVPHYLIDIVSTLPYSYCLFINVLFFGMSVVT